jgi:hypothetical protein
MIAFRGNPACKDAAIGRLLRAAGNDDVDAGYAITGSGGLSLSILGFFCGDDPVKQLEKALGLPVWFLEIVILVCENLPAIQARRWAVAVLQAVPVGAIVDLIHDAFIADLLADPDIGISRTAARDHRVKPLSDEFVEAVRHRHGHRTGSDRSLSEIFADVVALLDDLKDLAGIPYVARRREITRRYPLIYALYCLEHAQARHTVGILRRLIAIHTPVIPTRRALWVARTRGRHAVVPNFADGQLQERYSLAADRERCVQNIAERLLAIVLRCLSEADPSQVASFLDTFHRQFVRFAAKE